MLLLCLLTCPPGGFAEDTSNEALRKALSAAKILGEDNSFTVAINGSEAVISTYETGNARNPDNQCKILALLFGKTAFETNDKLAKIKACFYAKDQQSYRQVIVTAGDVEAFGSGRIDKEKTLNALELTVHKPESATAQKIEPAANRPLNAVDRANLQTFNKGGIAFYYPKRWSTGEIKGDGTYISQLATNGKHSWAVVHVRLQDVDSIQACCHYDVDFWRTHGKEALQPTSMTLGRSHEYPAIACISRDIADRKRFEKHVYFGSKHRIYSLTLAFDEQDYAELLPDFEKMLSTVTTAR